MRDRLSSKLIKFWTSHIYLLYSLCASVFEIDMMGRSSRGCFHSFCPFFLLFLLLFKLAPRLDSPVDDSYEEHRIVCYWCIFMQLYKGGVPGPDAPKIQALPEWGGGLTLAWIFVKDLSTCTEGPQR